MGRAPCCDKTNVKRGPWSPEEDAVLRNYVQTHGTSGNWIALPHKAGLNRCGKSCRLRWLNYLRPDIKRGVFSEKEDIIICTLYKSIGSRWSVIASNLPGRTDNDVKNYWNTKLKKKVMANQTPVKIPPFVPSNKSEANSIGEVSMPPVSDEGLNSAYGYSEDSQRLFWELSQFDLLESPDVNGSMSGFSSAASSSITPENSSNNGYMANWFVDGAGADELFLSELGFRSPPCEFLSGYMSYS